MATATKSEPRTYPIWVGNLHDNVTEGVLKQKFSGFGSIQSCRIMKDDKGKSKNFGYVNFVNKAKAENAAKKLSGCELNGKVVKTKGPSMLRKEGHLKQVKNYRPLTDCSFFIEGKGCSKGSECPYRHSEKAREQTDICKSWIKKSCVSVKCPKRHPRRQDTGTETAPGLTLNHSGSKSSLNTPVDFSDSEDSFDLSFYDYDSDLSSSHHSGINETPSPSRAHSIGDQSPAMAKFRKSDGQYDSTQSFTISSDEENDVDIQDINEEKEDFILYSSCDDEDDDDDDWDLNRGGPPSITRLLSLTKPTVRREVDEEEDEDEDDDNEEEPPPVDGDRSDSEVVVHTKPARKKRDSSNTSVAAATAATVHVPAPLEPVGLFWDIENCSVPLDKSAFALANKMRRVFFKGKREAEFMCVCDITKERKEVTDDLHRAHVTLVHVNAIAKNAADDKLKHSIRRFAQTFPPPATMVLVSGDVNFSFELNDARHVHNMTTILVHNAYTNEALKVCAHQTILFDEFVEDVEPPKFVVPPTATVLVVAHLPAVDPFKIKNRLSRLADNCGGRVLKVDTASWTARILFRSMEYALKAQKRMMGENVYGVKIRPEIETPPQPQPHVPPPSHRSNQQPYYYPQPPLRPGFQQPRPPPGRHPFQPVRGPPPPHHHLPSPHGYPPPPFGFPPPPRVLLPPPPKPIPVFKLYMEDLKVINEAEFDNLTAIFTETRLAVNIKSSLPEFFWQSFSSACLLSEFSVLQTAEMKKYHPLLRLIHTHSQIPSETVQNFLSLCLHDLSRECLRRNIPWNITVCKWNVEEENDRRVLSNVVSLLKQNERHWEKWQQFKESYGQWYKTALSEMMIQHCAGVIQLLGSGVPEDEIIMFSEFSPMVKIKKTEEFTKNTVTMLQSLPNNKIKLIEFVEVYQKHFGKLPVSGGRRGRDLQDILSSSPEFEIRGFKPCTLLVKLNDKPDPVTVQSKEPLVIIAAEFVDLLKQTPGNQLVLNRLQQVYQTKYHKSFRVSDIIPGDTGMRALVDACPGIKCISAQFGKKKETIVILSYQFEHPSVTKATTTASPLPTHFAGGPNMTGLSSDDDPLETFKADITELLNAFPDKKIQVSRIPEEYHRHFKKVYMLNKYGGKKTVTLLKSIPDVIMIDEESGERVAHLIVPEQPDDGGATVEEDHFTVEQCQRKVEELLYSLPNHHTTLDRFSCDYEAYFKEKMTSYCGHPKLLSLLQEMDETVVITGTGTQRGVCLHPLRVFALQMRELLSMYPSGMMLSAVVPDYNKRFGTEFRAENYGKMKLLAVMESIPDVVKITGVGAKRVVSLANPSPHAVPAEGTRQIFLDEVTSLLLTQPKGETTLEKLSAKFYNTFKKQINFRQLGYTSLQDAVKNLPNVKVAGEGGAAVVQLIADTVVESKGARRRNRHRPSQSETEVSADTKEIDNVSVEKEDLTLPQLITDKPREESEKTNSLSRPRLCETICLRLLSEIHRILLCHPEHSMMLEELCDSFKSTEEPSEPKPSDLMEAIQVYSGKKSQHKFTVSKVSEEFVFVALSVADAMWKLSKDIQYLFVYRPCGNYSMSLDEMLEVYRECHGRKLNPMVYKSQTVEKLMAYKQMKQLLIQFDEESRTVSLTLNARLEVFCQLACELLFKMEPECSHMAHFADCFEWYFKTRFSLQQLQAESLQDLVTRSQVAESIKVEDTGRHIVLTSRGLYCEQLRHLMMINNGRIPQGLLPTMYLSEFRHPKDQELLRCLHKKPIRYASHIVHLAAEFYIVWAPTGHPYPDTRAEKQSRILPDDRTATVSELGAVPEILASLVNDPLPPESITLDDDDLLNLIPEMPSLVDDIMSNGGRQHKGRFDISDLPGFSSLALTDTHTPGGMKEDDSSPPAGVQTDLITGLDHGEFAGMTHQSVLEQMKNDMRSEEDSRARLQRMGAYLDYFGELSALELERVDGPQVPKPKKSKGKPKLAIQFPGQLSTEGEDSVENSENKSDNPPSPRTSPTLGGDINGAEPDCFRHINNGRFLNHNINDWEDQLGNPPFGVNDDNYRREGGRASSPGSPTEWPSL